MTSTCTLRIWTLINLTSPDHPILSQSLLTVPRSSATMQRAWGHCRSRQGLVEPSAWKASVHANSSRKLAWVMGIPLQRPYIWWVPPIEVPEMAMDMSHFSQTMHFLKSTMCNDVYIGCRCLSSSSNCPSRHTFFMLKPSPGRFFLLFLSEAGAQAARSGLWIKFIRVLKVPINMNGMLCVRVLYVAFSVLLLLLLSLLLALSLGLSWSLSSFW